MCGISLSLHILHVLHPQREIVYCFSKQQQHSNILVLSALSALDYSSCTCPEELLSTVTSILVRMIKYPDRVHYHCPCRRNSSSLFSSFLFPPHFSCILIYTVLYARTEGRQSFFACMCETNHFKELQCDVCRGACCSCTLYKAVVAEVLYGGS